MLHAAYFRPLRIICLALLLSYASFGALATADDGETTEALVMLGQIKEHMLSALQNPQVRDSAGLRALVDEVLVPRVDFHAASQLVLGKHWKAATADQRERFITEFREFLVRFYSSALAGYISKADVPDTFMTFESEPLQSAKRQLSLRSHVSPPSGDSVAVDYRLFKTDAWRVIDVSVRGISLARSYRAGFDATIQTSGLDALIAELATRNASLPAN